MRGAADSAVIEIGTAGDGCFAVSEFAPGVPLDGLDSAGIRAALPGLLAALDAIRAIDVSGTEGYGIWAPDGTGPAASWAQALLGANQETARVPGWRAALVACPVGTEPFDRAYDRLRELCPALATPPCPAPPAPPEPPPRGSAPCNRPAHGPDSLPYTRVLEWIELPVVQRPRCS